MEEIEVWKDIPGYEGLYRVSTLGRIKSLSRLMVNGDSFFLSKDRILKPCIDTTGYYTINLWKERLPNTRKIHKLVAITFLGHKPCGNKLVIDHIDGNKLNNRLTNIQVVTSRANSSICFRRDRDKLTSIYVGVSWDKSSKKWHSGIRINGKYIHLGRFSSETEASDSYQKALGGL